MTSYTPKGNYPYPVATDPVTDYPASAATFAGYVDNLPNRNAITNGNFAITQRGTTFTNPATGTYSADRWRFDYDGTGGTRTITFPSISPGGSMDGMQAKNVIQIALTTLSTGGTYQRLAQRIEDVRTFANETITLSFWTYSSSPKTITARAVQNFGTGGSPSADVTTTIGTTTTSGAVYVRETFTVTLPSLSGKTIGTNENSFLEIHLDFGVQTGTLAFWGVQLEQNNTATALEREHIVETLAKCYRYFQRYSYSNGNQYVPQHPWQIDTLNRPAMALLYSEKRVAPVITISSAVTFQIASITSAANGNPSAFLGTLIGTKLQSAVIYWTQAWALNTPAIISLNPGAYIDISAEL